MAHQELGLQLLFRVRDELTEMAKVEAEPRLEGRQMIMILAPTREGAAGRSQRPQPAPARDRLSASGPDRAPRPPRPPLEIARPA